jgi:hypothetical protein
MVECFRCSGEFSPPNYDIHGNCKYCGNSGGIPNRYKQLRELRPDLYRKVVEVGLCITCGPITNTVLTTEQENMIHSAAAKAESRAVELLMECIEYYE